VYIYLQPDRLSWRFPTESHRVWFSDQSCSYCTPLTYCSSCDDINCQCANDTQIYGSCRPSEADALQQRLSVRVDDVSQWMMSNRLQLNPAKTEVLPCASAQRQHQIPTGLVHIGNTTVLPATAVCDLGVYLNADVSVAAHETAIVRTCFAALRHIRNRVITFLQPHVPVSR